MTLADFVEDRIAQYQAAPVAGQPGPLLSFLLITGHALAGFVTAHGTEAVVLEKDGKLLSIRRDAVIAWSDVGFSASGSLGTILSPSW